MRKLSMMMAAVMLFVSCMCVTVNAQTSPENSLAVSVNVPEEVGQGSEFTLSVDFAGNSGFNTLGVELTYPEGFTYRSAQASDLIEDKFFLNFAGYEGETYVFYHNEEARTITFVGASLYDIENESGKLFDVKFTAPEEASTANEFKVEIVDSIYNATGETVVFTKTDDSMNVIEITYQKGDVNRNGSVNIADAIWIFGYIADKNEIPEDDLELKTIADVNNSGTVNIADAVEVFKYIAS